MVAIAGGPVSQLERRTMPSIISGSVNDLRKKGLNIALAGSADFDRDPQSTQIVVFLTTVTFDQFFERFRSDQVLLSISRDFLSICGSILSSHPVSSAFVASRCGAVPFPTTCAVQSARALDGLYSSTYSTIAT